MPRTVAWCCAALLVLGVATPAQAKTTKSTKPKRPPTTSVAPVSLRTYATTCVGFRSCDAIAVGDVLYLVRHADGAITRLDPRRDAPQSLGSVGAQPGAVGLASLDNALWVLSSDSDPAMAALSKINANATKPGPPIQVKNDGREQMLTASNAKLWFATVEGASSPPEAISTVIPNFSVFGTRFSAQLASMAPTARAPTTSGDVGHGAIDRAALALIGIPLAASRNVIWAAVGFDQGLLDAPGFWGAIVPTDAATGEPGAGIDVQPIMVNAGTLTPIIQVVGVTYSFTFQSMSATPDALYALYRDVGGTPGRLVLVRIDAATKQATAVIVGTRFRFNEDTLPSVAGGGAVWIYDDGRTLRVDPATGVVAGCVPGVTLAVSERYRWAVDSASGAVSATPTSTPAGAC